MGRRLSKTTASHDEIRRWAQERGAVPAAVRGTRRGGEDPGLIRIDFPGYSGGRSLKKISWDEFFKKFDDKNLVLVFQERTSRGEKSNFNKLISATSARGSDRGGEEDDEGSDRGSRRGSRGGSRSRSDGSSRGGRRSSGSTRSSRSAGAGSRSRGSASRGRSSGSARSGRDADGRGASRGGTQHSGSRTGRASRGRAGSER